MAPEGLFGMESFIHTEKIKKQWLTSLMRGWWLTNSHTHLRRNQR